MYIRLTDSRNGPRKNQGPKNNKKTYGTIHANRKLNESATSNQPQLTNRSNPRPVRRKTPEDLFDRSLNKQQTVIIQQNKRPNNNNNNNSNQNFTPLATPTNFRKNTSADPYGINPLPTIKSPFVSARDPVLPNLESWGVVNSDPAFLSRYSPYLPTYTALTKNPKVNFCFN